MGVGNRGLGKGGFQRRGDGKAGVGNGAFARGAVLGNEGSGTGKVVKKRTEERKAGVVKGGIGAVELNPSPHTHRSPFPSASTACSHTDGARHVRLGNAGA